MRQTITTATNFQGCRRTHVHSRADRRKKKKRRRKKVPTALLFSSLFTFSLAFFLRHVDDFRKSDGTLECRWVLCFINTRVHALDAAKKKKRHIQT